MNDRFKGLGKLEKRRFTEEAAVRDRPRSGQEAEPIQKQKPVAEKPEPIKGRMVSMEGAYHDLVDELTFVPRRLNASRSDVFRAAVLCLSQQSDAAIEKLLKGVSESPLDCVRKDSRYQAMHSDD